MGIQTWFKPQGGMNGTLAVNNQLVSAPMSGAYFPNMSAYPHYKGSGQPPPTLPISFAGAGGTSATATAAMADPLSPTKSPVIIAVVALVVGILGLRYIHWRH